MMTEMTGHVRRNTHTAALVLLNHLLQRLLTTPQRGALVQRIGSLPTWALWLLPLVLLALLRLALLSPFPSTHALVGDWYNHASYFTVFLIGVGLAAQPQLFARLEALRWAALAVALLAWLGITAYDNHVRGLPAVPEDLRALQRVAYAGLQWSAIVALLGFAHRHLNRDHRWRAALNEAVFPLYLVHQSVIIVLAMALAPHALPAAAEAVLLVLLTFTLGLLFWRLARASGPLRPWLGLPSRRTRRPVHLPSCG